jgi:hypothetical protein
MRCLFYDDASQVAEKPLGVIPHGKRMQQPIQLDDSTVRNGSVLYDDDDPVSDDEAQVFPARLRHAIFVDDPHVPSNARVLVDNRSLDR